MQIPEEEAWEEHAEDGEEEEGGEEVRRGS